MKTTTSMAISKNSLLTYHSKVIVDTLVNTYVSVKVKSCKLPVYCYIDWNSINTNSDVLMLSNQFHIVPLIIVQ